MNSVEDFVAQLDVLAPAVPVRSRFWADRGGPAWRVAAGGVDLFLQRRSADDQPDGPLHHVMRAAAGELFFGGGADGLPDALALLAVPLPGTRLQVVGADLLQSPLAAAAVVALGEAWVGVLGRGLSLPPAPRQGELLAAGATLDAPPDGILRAAERVAWVEVVAGQLLWMERDDCVVDAASGPLPVPRELWLKAAGNVSLRVPDADELWRDGRLLAALALHQRFVLRAIASASRQATAGERQRLQARAEQSLILTREALQKLLSVAGQDTGVADPQAARRDACFAACQSIGRVAGIAFRLPNAADAVAMARDPVATIAAAARVRHRRVALKGRWWTGDNGPLLAVFADGGHWVALLPRRGGYDLHDPAGGPLQPVDEALAGRLSPFATMFYSALPDHALRLRDIITFSMRGRGADLAFVLALGAAMGLLGLAAPIATGSLVDTLIPSADRVGVWQMVGALVAAALATALFEATRSLAVLRIEGKTDSSLEAALWDRLLKLPVPFFRKYSAGDLALRVNGVNTIRRALSRTAVGSLLAGIFSIFNLLLLFHYSAPLAVVATLLVGFALLLTVAIGVVKLRYERQLSAVGGRLSALVYQYLNGIAKLRVGAAETRAFANWAELFARYRGLQFRAQHWGNVDHTLMTGYATLATVALFAAMGLWLAATADGRLSIGDFIAFSAAFGGFFAAMIGLTETAIGLLNLVPVYERTRPILETVPESDDDKAHPGELQGGLEIANLSFRYGDGPEVLRNVSFSVRPGGYIALVGPSGSGKSTLLRLLLGFEKPNGGSIYYDNQDLATVDVQALRRQLGVVLQDGKLIPGDIFTNIVGASSLTVDDAWAAARLVGLDEDIEQMPMGMHTVIGEGASTLSGGQRQRILIARAIVHRPRLIYFDEATSALDNRTQAIVTASLDRLKATRIVIAHRLSTIINADRIIVMRDGEIVQTGNYASLIGETGLFADLAKRQIV